MTKTQIPNILFFFSLPDHMFAERQRYDGWYNNLAHPNWGSAGKFYFKSSFKVDLVL